VAKGLTSLSPKMDYDQLAMGLPPGHLSSIYHSEVILLKYLRGISVMPLLPISGLSVNGLFVCYSKAMENCY
jgi:hypothetical protein